MKAVWEEEVKLRGEWIGFVRNS